MLSLALHFYFVTVAVLLGFVLEFWGEFCYVDQIVFWFCSDPLRTAFSWSGFLIPHCIVVYSPAFSILAVDFLKERTWDLHLHICQSYPAFQSIAFNVRKAPLLEGQLLFGFSFSENEGHPALLENISLADCDIISGTVLTQKLRMLAKGRN